MRNRNVKHKYLLNHNKIIISISYPKCYLQLLQHFPLVTYILEHKLKYPGTVPAVHSRYQHSRSHRIRLNRGFKMCHLKTHQPKI